MRFVGLETSETRERKDRRTRARLMRKRERVVEGEWRWFAPSR